MKDKSLLIGQVARQLGVSEGTVRRWDSELEPARIGAGSVRLYDARRVEAVRVRRAGRQ